MSYPLILESSQNMIKEFKKHPFGQAVEPFSAVLVPLSSGQVEYSFENFSLNYNYQRQDARLIFRYRF